MTLLIAHFALLAAMSYATARHLVADWIERIMAAAGLFWGNIVVLSLGLSCIEKLGEVPWFFRGSLLLGGLTWWLVARLVPGPPEPLPFTPPEGETRSRWLGVAVLGSLFLLFLANLRMAGSNPPNNYDSLAYHLPRVMYYMGHNTLAHFESADIRQVYFSFNYNLLQLACLIYSPPHEVINFLNIAAWVLAGLGVFRVSRLCGCSFNASLLATWLAITATEVLAQATTTTLDLPTVAALLAMLVFILRWMRAGRRVDAMLAGLAAGLAGGAKLTVVFFGPAVVVLLLVFLYQHWRQGAVARYFAGVRSWLIPGALAAGLAVPFILYNLAATGQWMTKQLDFTLNKPFSFACAVQTTKGYLGQLFLEPFGRFSYDLPLIGQLNAWFKKTLFAGWNPAHAYSDFYVIPPDLNEDHVWYGFAGPLFLVCGLVCLWRDRRLRGPIGWLALLGVGWFVTYFAMNKWSLYIQRYFLPAIVLMAPCAAAVWDRRPAVGTVLGTLKRWAFWAVSLTSLWFAIVYLDQNRNRPFFWPGSDFTPPVVMPDVPELLRDRLAEQSRINIISDGTNERIYLLMTAGRNQRFTSSTQVAPDKYNVFSFWGFTRNNIYANIAHIASHTLVAVPGKKTAGVEFLGTVGRGVDAFDYAGLPPNANETKASPANSNIVVLVRYGPTEPNRFMFCSLRVNGLNPGDHARVLVNAEMVDGSEVPIMAQTHSGEIKFGLTKPFKRLRIDVVDRETGAKLGAGDLPYAIKPSDADQPPLSGSALFRTELISTAPARSLSVNGLADLEGPYAKWDLPVFRWSKQPAVRIEIPANDKLRRIRLAFSLRLQVRDQAHLRVVHNGTIVDEFALRGRTEWVDRTLELTAGPGENVIELRDAPDDEVPDWLGYLEKNPDVKAFVIAQGVPLEEGARQHFEKHGQFETRILPKKPNPQLSAPPPDSLYFVYRHLVVEGLTDQ